MSREIRTAARVAGALWLATLVGAMAGRLIGGATGADGSAPSPQELFVDVLATNSRLVGVVALAAVLVLARPVWRWALDTVVVALLAVNALAVGSAIGAGGAEVAGGLVHLPLEWTALAVVTALYVAARRRALSAPTALRVGTAAVVLLVAAAAVEAWSPVLG